MTPAVDALSTAGVTYTLHEYTHDQNAQSYGLEAAERLGVEPDRVFKTLVVSLDGRLVVGVVPVTAMLDLKALARELNGSRARMADLPVAERATGYVAGGISPFGQKRALPTVVDETAHVWATLFVSGGRRGLDVEIAPDDLVEATGAIVADVSRW